MIEVLDLLYFPYQADGNLISNPCIKKTSALKVFKIQELIAYSLIFKQTVFWFKCGKESSQWKRFYYVRQIFLILWIFFSFMLLVIFDHQFLSRLCLSGVCSSSKYTIFGSNSWCFWCFLLRSLSACY